MGGGGRSTPGAARRRASPTFAGHQQKRTLPIERARGCARTWGEKKNKYLPTRREEKGLSHSYSSHNCTQQPDGEGQGLHFLLLLLQTPATLDEPVLGGRTLTHVDPRTCHLFRPFHPIERTCITRLSITRMQLTITSRLWGPSSPYRPPVRSDYSNCVAIARISLKNKTAHSRRVVQ